MFQTNLKRSVKQHKTKEISLRFGDFDIIFVVIVVIASAHQQPARLCDTQTSLASYSTITRYYTSFVRFPKSNNFF